MHSFLKSMGGITVWDFGYEVGDEEGGRRIGEFVSFQLQIFVETHDCGVLLSLVTFSPTGKQRIGQPTLSKTLSMNCIV